MHARRKPGRPTGSKTFWETPAVKRARSFLEKKHTGLKPNAAAKAVAADWQVSESTVFKDYERHLSRLIDDGISDALSRTVRPDIERLAVKAEAAANASARKLEELKIEIGRNFLIEYPDIAARFSRVYLIEFRRMLDEVAQRLDTGGNAAGAQAVRAFDIENTIKGDSWLMLLGQHYLAILRRSRNKTSR